MLGFQLVYPERVLSDKQYQKLYYLLTDESKELSALDLESAGEEVLEIEIFTTYDRTAVKKFLEDYFHGSYPSPRGKIPAVFERYYLGKLQLGFVLGTQAFIASTHRNNRDILEVAVQRFYLANGGVSVAKILDTSLKNRRLDKIVIEKVKETKYLPDKAVDQTSQTVVRTLEKDVPDKNLDFKDSNLDTQSDLSDIDSKSPIVEQEVIEYEDGGKGYPDEASKRLMPNLKTLDLDSTGGEVTGGNKSETSVELHNIPEDFNQNGLDKVEISSNAAFYYDIGRRYFISSQYELSKRYMNLAAKNGYRGDELNHYLSEIEKRLNPLSQTPIAFADPIKEPARNEGQSPLPRYDYDLEQTSPAVESGALDFDASDKDRNLSFGSDKQRNRALEEFYSEMEKMEAELRQYTNNKRQLSTSANGNYRNPGLAELAFQILALVALVLFFLSFLSTRRIPASPVCNDFSDNTNKNS